MSSDWQSVKPEQHSQFLWFFFQKCLVGEEWCCSQLWETWFTFFLFSRKETQWKRCRKDITLLEGVPKKQPTELSHFFGTPCTSDIKDFIAGSSKWDALLPIKGKHIANHTVASLQFSFLFFWIVYISRSGAGVKLSGGGEPQMYYKKNFGGGFPISHTQVPSPFRH